MDRDGMRPALKFIPLFLISLVLLGADLDDARKANNAYENGNYQKAESLYQQAIQDQPKNPKLQFNLANTLVKQNKLKEALSAYERYKTLVDQPEMKARAEYNMGNVYATQKKWGKAARHYREALKYDPADQDAKHNYEYAKRQQKEQQKKNQKQNQQKNQNKNQNNQKQKQQQNRNQQNQNQNKQNKQNQQSRQNQNQQQQKQSSNSQKQQSQKKGDKKQKQQQPRPQQMSKQEAQKILQALSNEEKALLRRFRKKQSSQNNSNNEKDW